MRPASGRQIELRAGDARAIVTEVGASIRRLALGGREVLDGVGPDEPALQAEGQALVPWPNRVQDGRYEFGGQEQQLALTEPNLGNAIHGFGRFAPWDVVEVAPEQARLRLFIPPQPGYPFALEVEVEHVLDESGLTVRTTGRNVGAAAAPYASGFHPYVTVGTPRIDEALLQFDAGVRVVTDDRGMPTGQRPAVAGTEFDFATPRAVGALQLDTAFGELGRDADGCAAVRLRAPDGHGVEVWVDEHHPYLMLFTGDTLPLSERRRRALAVEPMTCAPNGFRSGDGVRVLEAGESLTTAWGIRAT
jgi:aldose 1-epimerase